MNEGLTLYSVQDNRTIPDLIELHGVLMETASVSKIL